VTYLVIKYDMRAPAFGTDATHLYRAAVEQCRWADSHGFGTVMLAEHHGADDGYLPSPLVLAAAIATATKAIRLRSQALILPLHDPLRLAEDIAVLDLISGGRAEIVAAGGYVASEFAQFDKVLGARGKLVEENITALRQAWTGEPFDYRGRRVRVTPTPLQRPLPIALGGASVAAALRAARYADAFIPAMPELMENYRAECARLGRTAAPAERMGPMFLHVAEDPDRTWARIAPYALHESNGYGRWMAESMGDTALYTPTDDAAQLRASGAYQVVTPAQCVEIARQLGAGGRLVLHPLMGGMDPDLSWESLELFAAKVLPQLQVEAPAAVGRHLG
jgi:alkanesulfonate monooxygenase SsuD/methylene tetrahydromethanopterin reductase-like flavin-dependent oxidoreductase (luciferase family)